MYSQTKEQKGTWLMGDFCIHHWRSFLSPFKWILKDKLHRPKTNLKNPKHSKMYIFTALGTNWLYRSSISMPLITWCLIVVKFISFIHCLDSSLYCNTHKTPCIICTWWPLKISSFSTQKDWDSLHMYLKAVWLNKYISFAEYYRRRKEEREKGRKEEKERKKGLNCTLWKNTHFFIFLENIQIYTKKNLPQIHPGKTNIFAHCGLNMLILSSSMSLWKPSLDHFLHFLSHSNHFVFSGK